MFGMKAILNYQHGLGCIRIVLHDCMEAALPHGHAAGTHPICSLDVCFPQNCEFHVVDATNLFDIGCICYLLNYSRCLVLNGSRSNSDRYDSHKCHIHTKSNLQYIAAHIFGMG